MKLQYILSFTLFKFLNFFFTIKHKRRDEEKKRKQKISEQALKEILPFQRAYN